MAAIAAVVAAVVALACWDRLDALARELRTSTARLAARLDRVDPPYVDAHARMLGRVVEARKYEASEWERYVVVCVSWHGSVCLRAEDTPEERGFWLHRPGPDRLREVR